MPGLVNKLAEPSTTLVFDPIHPYKSSTQTNTQDECITNTDKGTKTLDPHINSIQPKPKPQIQTHPIPQTHTLTPPPRQK